MDPGGTIFGGVWCKNQHKTNLSRRKLDGEKVEEKINRAGWKVEVSLGPQN